MRMSGCSCLTRRQFRRDPTDALFADQSQSILDNLVALLRRSRAPLTRPNGSTSAEVYAARRWFSNCALACCQPASKADGTAAYEPRPNAALPSSDDDEPNCSTSALVSLGLEPVVPTSREWWLRCGCWSFSGGVSSPTDAVWNRATRGEANQCPSAARIPSRPP